MNLEIKSRPKVVVQVAREAFDHGYTRDLNYRIKALKQFKKFLEKNEEAIIKTMYDDLRKHSEESRLEVIMGINHIQYLINNVKSWAKPKRSRKRLVDTLDTLKIYQDPYGVVLIMGTWNVPLLTLLPAAGAIAAGNCVVIKPSHNSPSFAKMLADCLPNYLDFETYPVFVGNTEQTEALLKERFDYIYYTGSINFGRKVHLAANKFLTPTTLEMGGKNPVYIDSSADIKMTATRVMWGKCFNSGQACVAPDYILCSKDVERKFIRQARLAVVKFFGDELIKSCPIINGFHFQRLTSLMAGLNIALGGRTDPLENCIEPTIAVDVKSTDPIMQEEIFGPILAIITADSVEEAVKFINAREKPLAMYIFTKKSKVKDYLLENTSCGGVTVNDTLMHLMVESLPFGGVGSSGMGCYKGTYSFDTFTHKKGVLEKNFFSFVEKINENRYPPYSTAKTNFLAFILKHRREPSFGFLIYVLTFLLGVAIGVSIVVYYFYVAKDI